MKLTITEEDQSNAGPYIYPDECLVATMLLHRGKTNVKAGPFHVFLGDGGKTFEIKNYACVRGLYGRSGRKVRKSAIGKKIELVEVA